jgi:hypothetical protein
MRRVDVPASRRTLPACSANHSCTLSSPPTTIADEQPVAPPDETQKENVLPRCRLEDRERRRLRHHRRERDRPMQHGPGVCGWLRQEGRQGDLFVMLFLLTSALALELWSWAREAPSKIEPAQPGKLPVCARFWPSPSPSHRPNQISLGREQTPRPPKLRKWASQQTPPRSHQPPRTQRRYSAARRTPTAKAIGSAMRPLARARILHRLRLKFATKGRLLGTGQRPPLKPTTLTSPVE